MEISIYTKTVITKCTPLLNVKNLNKYVRKMVKAQLWISCFIQSDESIYRFVEPLVNKCQNITTFEACTRIFVECIRQTIWIWFAEINLFSFFSGNWSWYQACIRKMHFNEHLDNCSVFLTHLFRIRYAINIRRKK